MPRIDNEQFYKSAIEKHGVSAKGVQWISEKTQQVRFNVILNILPNDVSDLVIVDAGCGFGDFYFWMKKKKKLPSKYIGIDLLSDMVNIASKRTKQKIIKANICKDKLIDADYYICSGAMNVLERFETHLFIQNCYNSSKYGFIFNILHGDKNSETYNYMTTSQIQRIAKNLKITNVKIFSGYLDKDITVGFFKK
ncbi:MAG: class I SAM-dependent methyltransferase [Campylobacterota bacterium]|nr:class I SAM-dependent methyltransferase [Campylobacterota bacterium]